MKVLIGKYGQKVIFDRMTDEVQRSNTNGNVYLYKLMKLLFDNNKDDTFFLISNNIGSEIFDNVIDFSQNDVKSLNVLNDLDALIIIAGLGEYEKDERFIKIINEAKTKKFILIAEDPRCIQSMNDDNRLTRVPDIILTQTKGCITFKHQVVDMVYEPIQTSACYEESFYYNDRKAEGLLLVANTSGKEYDRHKIAGKILDDISCDVYGRLTEEDISFLKNGAYYGEVNFDEMIKVIRKAYYMLLIPIKNGWCTAKYLEAILNDTLPIFHKDYNVDLLGNNLLNKYVVESTEDLKFIIDYANKHKEVVENDMQEFRKTLVEPYMSGSVLSNRIMSYVKEE